MNRTEEICVIAKKKLGMCVLNQEYANKAKHIWLVIPFNALLSPLFLHQGCLFHRVAL